MGVKLGRLSLGFLNTSSLRAFMLGLGGSVHRNCADGRWFRRFTLLACDVPADFTVRCCAHFLEMTSLMESASDDESEAG